MDKTHLDPTRGALPLPPGAPKGPPNAPAGGPVDGSSLGRTDPLQDVRTLGDYRILRRLGEGGMGAVYLGYDERNDRQVAIKVLNDRLASNQSYIDRFNREAKSGRLLDHPNIVRTFFSGQDGTTGKRYLVLEFVDGPSAHALLAHQTRLSVGDAVHIALDVARALEYAHSRNIVHRDIKPDNVLITRSGVAKLVDLGLAKRTDEASHLTAARQGFGTTPYMPYEQAVEAKSADGRSDVYALGATLYHLVTGEVPFPGENHLEIVEKKGLGLFVPASMRNPDVPPALDRVLARMLARQPRDRYQTASEVIIDLERSKLAAPVPSFADPDQARKDPWVQACLVAGEPTRLDPDAPARPAEKAAAPLPTSGSDVWLLRYQTPAGRTCTVMTTAAQIVQRVKAGNVTLHDEARRPHEEEFHALSLFAEFHHLLPSKKRGAAKREDAPGPSPQSSRWALPAGLLAALIAGLGALVWWLGRNH